ncbi:lactate dehydrogenase [Pseudoalteromonas rubra]|uniref:Lactate dehydrogenase n=1 Tax=Pseudoalteromonas rubra TaxID=43658 RepID=A0A5S3WNQ6_9GAMM|nr:Ldh family oxidoreductase [Pseudoalteromonas rubra]TMP29958.1 lactate dehydrogenase [Pseudoalteromonas rubra]TMP32186.1 lactate dehydrogenase [Pseudoalteromonas rubra]
MTQSSFISAADVCSIMQRELVKLGLSQDDALLIADMLTDTSLEGTDTHGIRLFPTYVNEFIGGRAKVIPNIQFVHETPVGGLVDADGANGLVASSWAMREAICKAKQSWLGAVVVRNSNHFGAAANFTKMAAQEGLLGICMTNSDALVSLKGGLDAFLGTNPIAFSAPTPTGHFSADFATSQVSYSKIKKMLAANEAIPESWANIEHTGEGKSVRALTPLGGYKGQALGFFVQVMTALLAGMPFDHQLSHLYEAPYDSPRKVSHFFLAINPEMFIPLEQFKNDVARLMEEAMKVAPEAILPGELELKNKQARQETGIPVEPWLRDYMC